MTNENQNLPSRSRPLNDSGVAADERTLAAKLPFVLVHGGWQGAWAYERVIPLLARRGHTAVARDLPAHGLNARFPDSYWTRSLDNAAFAVEKSPASAVTLEDYITSVIQTIEEVRSFGHEQVALVGHSMGGLVITGVAERVPQYIARLVYVTAFMPKSGASLFDYHTAPENSGERIGPLAIANPTIVGALRMDYRSDSPDCRANGKLALCGDISDEDYLAMVSMMTPDVPLAPLVTPLFTTRERWGSVRRHYIKCLRDQAIRPALQQRFIEEANAFLPTRPINVHEMDTSHLPILSQPDALAELLSRIATN